jgi:hypothetical protein
MAIMISMRVKPFWQFNTLCSVFLDLIFTPVAT